LLIPNSNIQSNFQLLVQCQWYKAIGYNEVVVATEISDSSGKTYFGTNNLLISDII